MLDPKEAFLAHFGVVDADVKVYPLSREDVILWESCPHQSLHPSDVGADIQVKVLSDLIHDHMFLRGKHYHSLVEIILDHQPSVMF